MSKIKNIILAFCLVIILASCNYAALNKMNSAEPVGSPFLRQLAYEYRDFANEIKRYSLRHSTTTYLAEKALAASEGIMVMPEKIGGWDINEGNIVEITKARIDLINLLNNGGRDQAPYQAAVLQAVFDCWALGYKKHIIIRKQTGKGTCKVQFMASLSKLKNKMTPNTSDAIPQPILADDLTVAILPEDIIPSLPEPMAPTMEETKGPLAPIKNAMFIVFFDWDKAKLSKSSLKVISSITDELKLRKKIKRIIVIGYADTSGDSKYNNNLSITRAINIGNALISKGIKASLIMAKGRGENDLLVKTADNTREPSNRRVEITLE